MLPPETAPAPEHNKQPWFTLPTVTKPKTAIILGAGLSGCAMAEALARRGISVQLIDRCDAICQEASGNHQGVLYAKLPTAPTLAGEFHLCGLEYTLRLLMIKGCMDGKIASQCGVLQLATSAKEVARQNTLIASEHYPHEVVSSVSAEQASIIAGTDIQHQALYLPRAGWVQPKSFCDTLINHPYITLTLSTTVISIAQQSPTQPGDCSWSVTDQSDNQHSADILIVASATQAKEFNLLSHLPIKPIRGQVSVTPTASGMPVLKTVICGAGYISPSLDNRYSFGATFDLHDQSPQLRHVDHEANLTMLSNVVPDFANQLPPIDEWTGKVGYRCSTPDYLPIAGPAPIVHQYMDHYAKLQHDRKWKFANSPAPLHSGLYVNVGHGSKGLITAPLAAEYLAASICGEPLPFSRKISYALHPARFIIKSLVRSNNHNESQGVK
ncbi:FAD-dependent 5-carboxymethylaminomethyl-2-thiouridine(34) oxidoreductase MnmC [Neptunomonas antarctica]|uniref:tRNA 5-methylaminomethyl-2-thiouridine biosynthesis bifunctional protein n=1 Tax=Neptunomonas antarctica TaxID=619304 RepID=A0A1N7JD35_9GAMM|nr:FAD-dependent 5-carboxymethylaminomethyl-2-thiouridine(34) oxidoreductase MnmC [Neptunomonas antarctica]SIS47220.1 tRNA 5-methylaminomethyl-2-thiouridine biosynthesis bifunctional protein [Neptunomonas antarctica]